MYKEQFCKIYLKFFDETYFGRAKVPKVSTTYIQKGVERFIDGIVTESSKKYQKALLWNPSYFFLGDLFSDLRDDGIDSLEWVKFKKDSNEIEIDSEVFFTIMMLFREKLISKIKTLKDSGLPKWFKHQSYDGFCKDMNCILARTDLRQKIMKGRPKGCLFFRQSDEIFEFLKGSLTKEKITQVIDICKKSNHTKWIHRKGFRTVKEFDASAVLFLDTVKLVCTEMGLKDRRITKKKVIKYLMYLGLMSTIQSRSNQPVSMHSFKEAQFFTYYQPLRLAARKLGWLQVEDSTYCPGVRTRSFIVKIMCRPVKSSKEVISLNKIEKEYIKLADKNVAEADQFAVQYGYNAIDFLREKRSLLLRQRELSLVAKQNKSLSFTVREFGKKNGKFWTRMQYQKIRQNQGKKQTFHLDMLLFESKFSDPTNYLWLNSIPRRENCTSELVG